jgi:hypothetical protein
MFSHNHAIGRRRVQAMRSGGYQYAAKAARGGHRSELKLRRVIHSSLLSVQEQAERQKGGWR